MSYADFAADFGLDAAAIGLLACVIYFRRHRRRDLMMAYVCFNVALFVVVKVLGASSEASGLAFGLGLFGALSIIRLRSEELSYVEVAYFFSALALGIVNGVGLPDRLYAAMLDAVVLLAMYAMDHLAPRRDVRRLTLILDEACADEATLRDELERRPTEVLRKAVKGMLPRNRLARQQLGKLKIYAGPMHPHEEQAPQPLEVK